MGTLQYRSLVVDVSSTIQGDSEEELPEIILGGVRLNHPDVAAGKKLAYA